MNTLQSSGMSTADVQAIEAALMTGDLKPMTPGQRLGYYSALCKSLDINPLTMPFQYLVLNNKLVLYANKACAEQVRANKGISIYNVTKEIVDGLLVVTAYGRDREGREDTSTAALEVANLKGEAKANAFMKCETKAKRRLTLSLAGLGMLDEMEVETIPTARKMDHSQAMPTAARPAPVQAQPVQQAAPQPAPRAAVETVEAELEAPVDAVNEDALIDLIQVMAEENDRSEIEAAHNRFADAFKKSPATVGAAFDALQKRLKELKKA